MQLDTLNPANPADRASILGEIREHSGLFWTTGIVAILGGLLALAMPFAASLAANFMVAGLLVATGIIQVFSAFEARRAKRFLPPFAMGIVSVIAGLVLFFAPMAGVIALTAVVTGFLLVNGTLKTAFAFRMREARGWGWMLTNGILSLLLGVLLFAGLPGNAFWVIGLFLGIDLLFYGATMISLILTARRDGDAHGGHHGTPADVAG
jgi:uncharacterized membrane protein HdeD (DUF308 family)